MAEVLGESITRRFRHGSDILDDEGGLELFGLQDFEDAYDLEEKHRPGVFELEAGGIKPGETLARAASADYYFDGIHPAQQFGETAAGEVFHVSDVDHVWVEALGSPDRDWVDFGADVPERPDAEEIAG